jgi:hypothetical protein
VALKPALIAVPVPRAANRRVGLNSVNYARRAQPDYANIDAKNRRLGLAGEEAVLRGECEALTLAGRRDLAERVLHVSKLEGDGAGYDIKSYTPDGEEKFIEVKTTRGDEQTAFYLSRNEVQFSITQSGRYYLYRVFEFNQETGAGKVFVHRGELTDVFSLAAIQFKAERAPVQESGDRSAVAGLGS